MSEKIKFEAVMELREAIERLGQVVAGLTSGEVALSDTKQTVMLSPSRVVALELKAEKKSDKQKLSLELTWRKSK